MDDHEKQLYKMATDLYMTAHDRAVENGADEDEAHKIATNILVANYRSDD
jgi:cation transport regulator ChaB